MIPALFRALYLFGPLLALALIVMPVRRNLAWALWGLATVIVAFHWVGFLSAQEENAVKVGVFGIATWTPLMITTAIAGLTQNRWRGWHSNPFISQGVVCLVCITPSIIAFFLTR